MPKDIHQFYHSTIAERARIGMIQKWVENIFKSIMLFRRGRLAVVNRGTAVICYEVNVCAPEYVIITCFSGSHRQNPHESTSLIKYSKKQRK